MGNNPTPLPVNLAEPGTGPPLIDSQNVAMKIVIKRCDIHECIIDRGSSVNVISEATCQTLGLTHWQPSPIWLEMADTRSV